MTKPPQNAGFTLLELLLTIGVLAIMAALTMVGVATMKQSSDLTKCTHNLRLLQIAFSSFVAENDGRVPDKHPRRLYQYLNMDDGENEVDSPYTCPTIQRGASRALDAYHRNIAINIYATTEKIIEPDRFNRIKTPSAMLLFTEGAPYGEIIAPDGRKGQRYLSTVRLEKAEDLLMPHRKLQNAIFADGSARLIDKVEFYQEGRWNTPFWRGY